DLNRAIQQWRTDLAQSPTFCTENLDELESHLQDSVRTLEARGLSGEEAFLIATNRMGRGAALAPEFGKINIQTIWLDRGLWLLLGAQISTFFPTCLWTLGQHLILSTLHRSGFDFSAYPSIAPAILVIADLSVFAGSAAMCWLVIRRWGAIVIAWA